VLAIAQRFPGKRPSSAGWPDEFAKKRPRGSPTHFSVQLTTFHRGKLATPKFELLLLIFEKLPWANNRLKKAKIRQTRGRRYAHNFLQFSTIFRRKKCSFFINQCYEQIFAYFSFASKTPIFVAKKLAKIFFFNHNIGPRKNWRFVKNQSHNKIFA
jgi:hypothetical protein